MVLFGLFWPQLVPLGHISPLFRKRKLKDLAIQSSFAAASTPIYVIQNSYANACQENSGDSTENEGTVTGRRPPPQQEKACRKGGSFRAATMCKAQGAGKKGDSTEKAGRSA